MCTSGTEYTVQSFLLIVIRPVFAYALWIPTQDTQSESLAAVTSGIPNYAGNGNLSYLPPACLQPLVTMTKLK